MHALLVRRLRLTTAAVALVSLFFAVPVAVPAASAQVCPYNSTQGSCACPTSGGGTTCFGGQLYRSIDSSCQSDSRPCAANQQYECASEACACNTASYPCGGCTAASSAVGVSCGLPANGKYADVCGTCACPSGTTLCSSAKTCVTNLVCSAGTTFDPCTNSCSTPNVLLSPGWTQSGFIKVDGNITTTAGSAFLGSDLYLPNGKAIRVDGAGATSLNIGNWGGGAFTFSVNGVGSNLCLGGICRAAWPSTSDFNPVYTSKAGDTMTGTLSITGASSDLYVAGKLGVGTTTPGAKVDIVGPATGTGISLRVGGGGDTVLGAGGSLFFDNNYSYGGGNYIRPVAANTQAFFTAGGERMRIDSTGNVGIGTPSPGAKLDVNGTAKMTGFQLGNATTNGFVLTANASGVGTWQPNSAVTGGGSTNYLPKFTAATTLGNSQIYDDGLNVGVGQASPAYTLDVLGHVNADSMGGAGGYISTGNYGGTGTAAYFPFGLYSNGGSAWIYGTVYHNGQLIDTSNRWSISPAGPSWFKGGNVGIGTTTPNVPLAVGGNGTDVYGTSAWIENNLHVQGNEPVDRGRGRLRLGTVSNHVGMYAEKNSDGASSDLILGASSDYVHIDASTFGQGGGSGTLELWGSRIGDTGGGTLFLQSGGSIIDLRSYVYVNGNDTIENRGDGWLRLNQNGSYNNGVYTPYFLNAGSMTVGAIYQSPGAGNMTVSGDMTVVGNATVVGNFLAGTIISNYWAGWQQVSASNGGDTGDIRINWNNGACLTTDRYAMIQSVSHFWQNARCAAWQGNDGCWYKRAMTWGANTYVNCEWYVMRFK